MFDQFVREEYISKPYVRRDNGNVLRALQNRLNSSGQITSIIQAATRDVESSALFKRRGYGHEVHELIDSEAQMISDGFPVKLTFTRDFHTDKGCLINPSSFYFSHVPSRALLDYFSSANDKDIKFVRKCLRESRFARKKEDKK